MKSIFFFTEEINKTAISLNNDKIIQSIDSIETYVHEMFKDLVCNKEQIKCNNIIKSTKMFNFHYILKEDIKGHNPNWPEIPDHPYKILIVGGFRSGKPNALINLINHEPDIDKVCLYVKDLDGAKYQLLINKRESTGLKCLKISLNTQIIWMIFI